MKRNITAIFFLFCLIAPITITVIILKYQRAVVRKEIKRSMIAGIDKKELILLKFTEEEKRQLDWEHSKEFEFKEVMYDVVETEVKGDTTYYFCLEDEKETALNQQLDRLVAYALGNDLQNQNSNKKLLSFLESLYFSTTQTNEFSKIGDGNSTDNRLFQLEIYSSFIKSPIVPPPESHR